MDGFAVPVEDLAATARASTAVTEGIRGIDLAAAADAVSAALPGGRSGEAANRARATAMTPRTERSVT